MMLSLLLFTLHSHAASFPKKFNCTELGEKNSGMVMEYSLNLESNPKTLEISGFQTFSNFEVSTQEEKNSLKVFYEADTSPIVEGREPFYKKGDLLFTLEVSSKKKSNWSVVFKKLRPSFNQKAKKIDCE